MTSYIFKDIFLGLIVGKQNGCKFYDKMAVNCTFLREKKVTFSYY